MAVKAIVWDMGGVILYMRDEAPRKQLASDYHLPLERIYAAIFDSATAQQAMVGLITVEEHWRNVGESLGIPADELVNFLERFWSSDAIDFSLIGIIKQLKANYKTGVLSNAWGDLREIMANRWNITSAFDDIVISAEVGLAKPNPQIYQLTADRLGILPGEIIFIDDLARNIQAAQEIGFRTIQFITRAQVLRDLTRILESDGEGIPAELQQIIENLRVSKNERPFNVYDLIQLQIELEYQLDAQEHIIPFPGSSEQARLIIYQSSNGIWSFFQPDFPPTVKEEILWVGSRQAFESPQEFQKSLSKLGQYQLCGPFHSYIFPENFAGDFPEVRENGGRYEILIDKVPVSWAWSIRENQYCCEVAVETAPGFRQRGFARRVTAAWGQAIQRQGRVAFYSHAADNHPSRALARSLGLVKFAESIGIE